jgi:hypothetical protein
VQGTPIGRSIITHWTWDGDMDCPTEQRRRNVTERKRETKKKTEMSMKERNRKSNGGEMRFLPDAV